MNNFIEKIVSLLSTTSLLGVYSPSLKENEKGIAAIQLLPSANNTINSLENNLLYKNVSFSVVIKGSNDDSYSLGLADEVFNKLHNVLEESFTGGKIINMECSTPAFAYTTENEYIVYVVNGTAQVQ